MSRRGLRDRWRSEVLRATRITDSVRVVLLILADSMTDAGYVSVPRSELAATLNRSPRRVTERLELAREAGYLAVVRPAMPGRTAEYVATLPEASQGAPVRTSTNGHKSGLERGGLQPPFVAPFRTSTERGTSDARGADGGPPNTRALPTATKNEERTDEKTPAHFHAAVDAPHPPPCECTIECLAATIAARRLGQTA
jgi:hypothetical protein